MSGSKVVITNGELVPAFEALSTLAKEKFGITFSFQIKRTLAVLKAPLETYSDARNEIVEEFARRDESGAKVTTADGAVVEMTGNWIPKMRELNSLEAVRITPLSARELISACEAIDATVSGQLLSDLGSLLNDDLDQEEVRSTAPQAYTNGAVHAVEALPEVQQ